MDTLLKKRQIISALNKLDLHSAEYNSIRNDIRSLLDDVCFQFQEIVVGQKLYRARKTTTTPETINDLVNPPDNRVTDFQRCNPPGRAIFYCASCTHSAMREIGVEVGDHVYVSEWNVKYPFLAISIHSEPASAVTDNCSVMVSTFFETKFLDPVHETFSTQYKITSAIFEEMTNFFPKTVLAHGSDKSIIERGVHAMVYPSIANRKKSDCLAIDPGFARKHLAINFVEHRVVNCIEDNAVHFDKKRYTEGFAPAGIDWPKDGQMIFANSDNADKYFATGTNMTPTIKKTKK